MVSGFIGVYWLLSATGQRILHYSLPSRDPLWIPASSCILQEVMSIIYFTSFNFRLALKCIDLTFLQFVMTGDKQRSLGVMKRSQRGRPRRAIPAAYNPKFVEGRVSLLADWLGAGKSLGHELGLSHSIIYCWFRETGKRLIPSPENVLRLALLDAARQNSNPVESYTLWLKNTGVEKTSPTHTEKEIVEASGILAMRCKAALKNLIGELTGKGFSEFQARTALSAFLGQWSLDELVAAWQRQSHGSGQAAFFWSWRDGDVVARFTSDPFQKAVKDYLGKILRSASEDEPSHNGSSPNRHNRVFAFIVHADSSAVNRLKEIKAKYYGGRDWENLEFRVQTGTGGGSLEQWVDAWAFAGPTTEPFGFLASEHPDLFNLLAVGTSWEFRLNPFRWSSQIVYLSRENLPVFLMERDVKFSPARKVFEPIEGDGKWQRID
jgi:hypothetical protein